MKQIIRDTINNLFPDNLTVGDIIAMAESGLLGIDGKEDIRNIEELSEEDIKNGDFTISEMIKYFRKKTIRELNE